MQITYSEDTAPDQHFPSTRICTCQNYIGVCSYVVLKRYFSEVVITARKPPSIEVSKRQDHQITVGGMNPTTTTTISEIYRN